MSVIDNPPASQNGQKGQSQHNGERSRSDNPLLAYGVPIGRGPDALARWAAQMPPLESIGREPMGRESMGRESMGRENQPERASQSGSSPGHSSGFDSLTCQWTNCGERCSSPEALYVSVLF